MLIRTSATHPNLSLPTPDSLHRLDLYLSPRTETSPRGQPIPLYHLVLIRLRDIRTLADTRTTRHEARIMSPDSLHLQLSIPGDPERFITIDLRTSTCGEENFRGPTGPTLPLEQLATLL